MLDRCCFQPRWIVLVLLGLGCGSESDDADEGSMVEIVADDGTCTLDDGTYLFSYAPISGDCGPFPDEVIVIQGGDGFGAGMSDEVDCDETFSCDGGNLVGQARCMATLGGDAVEIRRLFTFDVESMRGVLDLRVLESASADGCSSTYRVVASNQDAEGGSDGGGGGAPGASGSSGGNAGGGGSDCGECGSLANGEECAQDADCISHDCGLSTSGDYFCYGDAALGEACSITQDCHEGVCGGGTCVDPDGLPEESIECETTSECGGGACVSRIRGTSDRLCVDGLSVCRELSISGTCFEDLAVASCQSTQACGDDVPNEFDHCIEFSCTWWYENLTASECPGQLDYVLGRGCEEM